MRHALFLCTWVLGAELMAPSLKGKCFTDRATSPVPTSIPFRLISVFWMTLLLLFILSILYAYVGFVWIHVCIPCSGLLPESRRRHQVLWNWSYRCFWANREVLAAKRRSFARAMSDLNHRANSSSLTWSCLKEAFASWEIPDVCTKVGQRHVGHIQLPVTLW